MTRTMRFVEILALRDGEVLTQAKVWEDGGFEGRAEWMATVETARMQANVPPRGDALLEWVRTRFDRGAVATYGGEGLPTAVRVHLGTNWPNRAEGSC